MDNMTVADNVKELRSILFAWRVDKLDFLATKAIGQ
jgi:hypothetical protein